METLYRIEDVRDALNADMRENFKQVLGYESPKGNITIGRALDLFEEEDWRNRHYESVGIAETKIRGCENFAEFLETAKGLGLSPYILKEIWEEYWSRYREEIIENEEQDHRGEEAYYLA